MTALTTVLVRRTLPAAIKGAIKAITNPKDLILIVAVTQHLILINDNTTHPSTLIRLVALELLGRTMEVNNFNINSS